MIWANPVVHKVNCCSVVLAERLRRQTRNRQTLCPNPLPTLHLWLARFPHIWFLLFTQIAGAPVDVEQGPMNETFCLIDACTRPEVLKKFIVLAWRSCSAAAAACFPPAFLVRLRANSLCKGFKGLYGLEFRFRKA